MRINSRTKISIISKYDPLDDRHIDNIKQGVV